ncbi:MAG: cation-translocating P-type ATPase [Candidatus Bathyarchaeia archaeon]
MEQKAWHSMNVEEVLQNLKTGVDGLREDEAERRLQEYGPNELKAERKRSPIKLLLEQFTNILIIILIIATIFSALIGEYVDAVVILIIVVASAGLGFTQEYRAEKAIEALRKMLSPTITVIRSGIEKNIPSKDLVPGDLIILKAGDKIPADARLIEATNLNIDESPLTGESVPVTKNLELQPVDTYIADRRNVVYSGTTVTYGKGKAVITATGMSTEFGKIAKEVAETVEEQTPLERRTAEIGRWLGAISLLVCFSVAGFGMVREYFFKGALSIPFILEMVTFGIALAVAAVPEALPAIVTGTLAIGMHEMAKRNALVRRMPAVETLGCTTVICADKTGTLTKGEMTVRRIYVDGKTVEVTGVGYEPKGELYTKEGGIDIKSKTFFLLASAAILCNDAKLEFKEGRWQISGDPTEGALIVASEKAGYHQEELRSKYPRIGEVPFSSERKRMSTVHPWLDGKRVVFVKGAPEVVLERCNHIDEKGKIERLTDAKRLEILKVNEEMAANALRVLSFAYKPIPDSIVDFNEENLERDLTFLGLMGMIDPPREEAVEAVAVSRRVGMKPIMITGDHKLTAVAIAKEMGIYKDGDIALTGSELEGMSEEELERIVDEVTVYARVSPIHKLKIVKAWKSRGEVVAMTGDGVNDAPAVKHADIGIAMGITGTEVTKEASDMVLADDNFATIVKAIEQGRRIFDNIKKYLTYLLQCNIIEILVIGGGVLAGLPLPLLPAQILWVNLATDGPPALALGMSPPDPDIMNRPPRNPKETVFTGEVKAMLTLAPLVLSPILLLVFINDLNLSVEEARTTLFLVFVFFELMVALNCRSLTHSIFKVKPDRYLSLAVASSAIPTFAILGVPQIREAFGIVMPTVSDIILATLLSLLPLVLLEVMKYWLAKKTAKSSLAVRSSIMGA